MTMKLKVIVVLDARACVGREETWLTSKFFRFKACQVSFLIYDVVLLFLTLHPVVTRLNMEFGVT